MQNTYQFISDKGVFSLPGAADYSDLYLPVAGECGIKSAVTPTLGGDCKLDQNTFLLEPVSVENLHNNRNARNFWCHIGTHGSWSATGNSAEEIAKKFTDLADENEVTAGFMWQTVTRTSRKYQLSAQITSFVPLDDPMEIMYVEITNTGNMQVRFTPTAAIPVYGRSADNLRDHRHVTSLLHRIRTVENGVLVTPTMSFDERGHRPNEMTYFVCGYDQTGEAPEDFTRPCRILSAREVILSGQRRLSKILPVCRRAVHMPDVRRSADSILRRGFLHRARPQDTRS